MQMSPAVEADACLPQSDGSRTAQPDRCGSREFHSFVKAVAVRARATVWRAPCLWLERVLRPVRRFTPSFGALRRTHRAGEDAAAIWRLVANAKRCERRTADDRGGKERPYQAESDGAAY